MDRAHNILQYKNKTQLMYNLLHVYVQEMREGQPSLKGFCDSGKLLGDSSTRQCQQFHSSPGHLTTNETNVLMTGILTNPVTAFLISFLSF